MFAFAPLRYTAPDRVNNWIAKHPKLKDTFDQIGYTDSVVVQDDTILETAGHIAWLKEIEFPLPLLDSVTVALLAEHGMTRIAFSHRRRPDFELRLFNLSAALRIKSGLLRRVRQDNNGKWVADVDAKGAPKPVEIVLSGAEVVLTADANARIIGAPALSLPAVMLGDSGVVLELTEVALFLSDKDTDTPQPGFKGVAIRGAALHFTSPLDIDALPDVHLTDLLIGSTGFSGKVTATWKNASSDQADDGKSTFAGIPFTPSELSLEFKQNVPVRSSLKGVLVLPFFDEPANVEISFGVDGGFHVVLDGTDGPFYTLTKEKVLKIALDSIAFELDDGLFAVKLSGKLTPLFGNAQGLKWPTFDIKDLSIDSKGNIRLPGGWLTLTQQKTFDFHGFKIEISQIGFGKNDDGSKWIGFSGGLKLVANLQAGASVEGLRITWNPGGQPKISLNGVKVEFEVPGVLHLTGGVSYREITDAEGNLIRRFDGDIHLTIETPEIEIDGMMVIGSVKGEQGRYNFFAIYCDVELPTGLPVASTGLGIYGFAGLLALQMEPNKKPDEMWFSIDHGKSFYHRNTPGITDLKNKWDPRKGSFALGAGITLGTLSDNGYTFNGKFLLAVVIPGPIVLIQGAASFLKKRADGESEGQFRALTVIDGRAGSILIGLDAEYKTGKGGELIDIGGSMEAFYAFHDPTAWHLYLGINEPRELRIRAIFARLVEANAYFMLDAHQLALGAWFGYNNGWNFGPLSVRLEAWADGNARLSFKPTHFHGDLWLHCLVALKAFGIGLGLALDARITADLFKPYHLRGEFSVGIKIPLRKKKIGARVVLEWGPRKKAPSIPAPVVEIGVEHLKSSVAWPLPRGKFLRPSYDDGEGFLVLASPGEAVDPAAGDVPRVPLDARIAVTFARSTHDTAKVGINLQPVVPPFEAIGDPAAGHVLAVKYELEAVTLERWDGAWKTVARSPKTGSTSTLFGSWMPVPQLPDAGASPQRLGQTKLLLWSKTPFDFTRHTGSSWEEWVSDSLPGYPCIPVLPAQETCFLFGSLQPGSRIESPWTYAGPPAVTLSWGFGPATVGARTVTADGVIRTIPILCFPESAVRRGVRIHSDVPGQRFRIVLAPGASGGPPQPAPAPPVAAVSARVISTIDVTPLCIDFRPRTAGTLTNPWSAEEGGRFTVRDAGGGLAALSRIERWGTGPLGLNAGFLLEVDLPFPSSWVELLVTHRPPFRIVAFDAAGAAVATHAPGGSGGEVTETIRLEGEAITRLRVYASGNEKLIHRVCFARPTGTRATGFDVAHVPFGPFFPVGDVITVDGPEVPVVVLAGDGPLCLEGICVTPDPEAGQGVRREEAIRHMRDELGRWQAEEPVLEPDTFYRLTVQTRLALSPASPDLEELTGIRSLLERAYFHTARPPGLEKLRPPEGVPEDRFDSGLDDLVRYVRQTTPPTVPEPGGKPILYKPFYRAFDIWVEFNESYVEQMYRMDRRDLGLYLYDGNNQPVRDALGRLLALQPSWGRTESLSLSEKETRWLTLIDAATCLPTKPDPKTFPHDAVLLSAEERVLAPDTLHEARLVSLLLHESFTAGPLGEAPPGWFVENAGPGGPSVWQVGEVGEPPSRVVEQASAIGGVAAPERPGTLLLFSESSGWTDYRVSVYVRSAAGGAVGVVVRHQGPGTGYRFSLDGRVRRLAKLEPAGATLLAEDHFAYRKNRDYLVTFEALGSSLRVYVDGAPVFDVTDGALQSGRIGLYACQSPGARFTDVRVDDFRTAAPVVYRFQLTTSLYANFFHHLHSFQDETWKAGLGADPAVDELLAEAVLPSFSLPEEKEARAYEALAELALGPAAARQNPARVEVTRLERDGAPFGFLVRSPEPFAWDRIELALSGTLHRPAATEPPGAVKLTDATFGAVLPADESVTLLLREAMDLSLHRVELRALPGVLAEPAGDPVVLLERFEGDPAATRARFTVVDQGTAGGPSDWRVEGGALIQISEIRGGAEPELPGTVALAGDPDWTDYRLTVDLRSDSGSAVGVVFRWVDGDNHYRLSLDAGLQYRRLVKSDQGQVSILWEEEKGYAAGEPLRLTVEAVGSRLTGFLGNDRLFELRDGSHAAGQVGLYACANPDARFEAVEVRRPSLDAYALARDRFAAGDLTDWGRVDEAVGAQPSSWSINGGELRLSSFVQQGDGPDFTGTYAYTGDPEWTDVVYRARLRCPTGGAIGMLFRGRDLRDHYRFSMNAQVPYRQLIKRVNGEVTVLWQDAGSYATDRSHELAVVAVGSSLRGSLDGIPLFVVEDGDLPSGLLALYARNNESAFFSEVRVFPADRTFADWRLDESFEALVPDRWHFQDAVQSLPDGWAAEHGELRPAGDDPSGLRIAVTGDPAAADSRLAVRLRPGAVGITGVVFHFLDVDNCYVFLLDPGTGSHRMVKRVAGQETVLWQGTVVVTPGREIGITFDVLGERLAGWLDGMELFRVHDADLPAGRLGFFVAGSPDTRFTEVRTSEPEWSTWYGFGGEDRRPAGTRVRIHAGWEAGASSTAGNLESRSAAAPGETGRLRFPAGGVELRVTGPPEGEGHARTFVPLHEHVPLASPGPRVVRRADGTGFVLLPFGGSPLVEGQYRLELTYHRERPGQVHPFSQAWDRSPERAVLDIPWKTR